MGNNYNSSQGYNNSNHIFSQRHNYDDMIQNNYSENYNNYNEIPPNYSYPGYYYGQGYQWSNFNFQLEKEQRRWTYDDKIRLQRGLKIIQNHLEKFYHPFYVSRIILMLKRKCNHEKSDEPLKKYFIQMNIGAMWPW